MRTRRAVLALLAVALATTVACVAPGADDPMDAPVAPGRFAEEVDLTDTTIRVGGKEFDEQLVLCRMTIVLLRSAGATAEDHCGTDGSGAVRAALVAGRIDMYWEYTGTAWRTYLGQDTMLAGPAELHAAVRDADVANGVVWLDPAPFDNSYAIGVRSATAQALGLRTLSDLSRLRAAGSPLVTVCVDQEFAGREDGLVGLLATYDLTLDGGRLTTRPADEIYPAIVAGSPCVFGEVFATDGRLDALRIATLVDDRGYFLPYNGALTVRRETLDQDPRLALLGRSLAPTLTDSVMRELNGRVSVGGRSPDEVARSFLRERGLIG